MSYFYYKIPIGIIFTVHYMFNQKKLKHMYTLNINRMFDNFFNEERSTRVSNDGERIYLALPGFSKKDVNVEVEGRKLVISAEVSEDNETAYRRSFKKVYFLPSDVDTDVISAKMENGVLQILFGKAETAKKIKIG